MFITIHCGGLPFNGNTIEERSLGGSETAAYYMAKELAADGNNVTIFTNDVKEGIFDKVRYVYAGTPSERFPYGDRFHQYAESTPVDVLIIQRSPTAFNTNFPAKNKLLWLHDLASSTQKDLVQQSLFFIDGILTVSEMHKEQVVIRAIQEVKKRLSFDFDATPGYLTLQNETRNFIRFKGLKYVLVGEVLDEFKKQGIDFRRSKKVASYDTLIRVHKFFSLEQINESIFKDYENKNISDNFLRLYLLW